MSDMVKIILTGKVRSGFERAEVVAALAKMLKIGDGEASALLEDRETILKRDVPTAVASRHIQILREVGAKARVEAMPAAQRIEPALSAMEGNPRPSPMTDSRPAASRPSTQALELVPIAEPKPVSEIRPYSGPLGPGDPGNGPYGDSGRLPAPAMFGLSLNGRIGRLRYLVYGWLGMALIAFAGGLLLTLAGFSLRRFPASSTPGGLWLLGAAVLGLAVLWMSIRVSVLRLHDVNLSGKWFLGFCLFGVGAGMTRSPGMLTFTVILSWLISIALLLWPGSAQENDYGEPPRANTLLIYLGAMLVILLAVIGLGSYARRGLPFG